MDNGPSRGAGPDVQSIERRKLAQQLGVQPAAAPSDREHADGRGPTRRGFKKQKSGDGAWSASSSGGVPSEDSDPGSDASSGSPTKAGSAAEAAGVAWAPAVPHTLQRYSRWAGGAQQALQLRVPATLQPDRVAHLLRRERWAPAGEAAAKPPGGGWAGSVALREAAEIEFLATLPLEVTHKDAAALLGVGANRLYERARVLFSWLPEAQGDFEWPRFLAALRGHLARTSAQAGAAALGGAVAARQLPITRGDAGSKGEAGEFRARSGDGGSGKPSGELSASLDSHERASAAGEPSLKEETELVQNWTPSTATVAVTFEEKQTGRRHILKAPVLPSFASYFPRLRMWARQHLGWQHVSGNPDPRSTATAFLSPGEQACQLVGFLISLERPPDGKAICHILGLEFRPLSRMIREELGIPEDTFKLALTGKVAWRDLEAMIREEEELLEAMGRASGPVAVAFEHKQTGKLHTVNFPRLPAFPSCFPRFCEWAELQLGWQHVSGDPTQGPGSAADTPLWSPSEQAWQLIRFMLRLEPPLDEQAICRMLGIGSDRLRQMIREDWGLSENEFRYVLAWEHSRRDLDATMHAVGELPQAVPAAGAPEDAQPAAAFVAGPATADADLPGPSLGPAGSAEQPPTERLQGAAQPAAPPGDRDATDASAALFLAAASGDVARLQSLLAAGAHPDSRDAEGATALHHAAANGRSTCVETLVCAGADVEAVDGGPRRTALHHAAWGGHRDAVAALLAAGASVAAVEAKGATPLHHAAADGHTGCVERLLDGGAEVDAGDANASTPLHMAAWAGHAACTAALLLRGATPAARDSRGRTPLHHAAAFGHGGCLQALLDSGVPPSAADEAGQTPLHLAAARGHPACIAALLAAGADASLADGSGATARDLAAAEGDIACLAALEPVQQRSLARRLSRTQRSRSKRGTPPPSTAEQDPEALAAAEAAAEAAAAALLAEEEEAQRQEAAAAAKAARKWKSKAERRRQGQERERERQEKEAVQLAEQAAHQARLAQQAQQAQQAQRQPGQQPLQRSQSQRALQAQRKGKEQARHQDRREKAAGSKAAGLAEEEEAEAQRRQQASTAASQAGQQQQQQSPAAAFQVEQQQQQPSPAAASQAKQRRQQHSPATVLQAGQQQQQAPAAASQAEPQQQQAPAAALQVELQQQQRSDASSPLALAAAPSAAPWPAPVLVMEETAAAITRATKAVLGLGHDRHAAALLKELAASGEESCAAVVAAGAIPSLVACLETPAGQAAASTRAFAAACLSLVAVRGSAAARSAIIAARGVVALASILTSLRPEGCQLAVEALGALATHAVSLRWAGSDRLQNAFSLAVTRLAQLMTQHLGHENLQSAAALAGRKACTAVLAPRATQQERWSALASKMECASGGDIFAAAGALVAEGARQEPAGLAVAAPLAELAKLLRRGGPAAQQEAVRQLGALCGSLPALEEPLLASGAVLELGKLADAGNRNDPPPAAAVQAALAAVDRLARASPRIMQALNALRQAPSSNLRFEGAGESFGAARSSPHGPLSLGPGSQPTPSEHGASPEPLYQHLPAMLARAAAASAPAAARAKPGGQPTPPSGGPADAALDDVDAFLEALLLSDEDAAAKDTQPGQQQQAEQPKPGSSPAAAPPGAAVPSRLRECSICLEELAPDQLLALLPCGHRCACADCVRLLTGRSCPICRTQVTGSLRVYDT